MGGAISAYQTTKVAATSMTYPGTPASVTVARRLVRVLLAGSPRLDDLEVIAAELMTNAIRHTPSGHNGGTFTLTVRCAPEMAWIEVEDDGCRQWNAPPCDGGAEYGRGLVLVTALADESGYDVSRGQTQVAWAQVSWQPDAAG